MDADRLALHDAADRRRDTAEKIPEFRIRNDLLVEFKQELKSISFRVQLERVINGPHSWLKAAILLIRAKSTRC